MPYFKVVTSHSCEYQDKFPEQKYHDEESIHDVIDYIFRASKTRIDCVGGIAVNPAMAEIQFTTVANSFGKNYGVRLRHMVLSFSPEENISLDNLKQIAYQVASYFGSDYQIIFAIHLDSTHPHVHFVQNTVSYRSGKKYSGSKKDYGVFVDYLKTLLKQYGYPILIV